jgi:hypothetical protein
MKPESDDNERDPLWDDQWFDEFSEMADRRLGDGSACEQIHPVVEAWFEALNAQEPPPMRPSVEQALSCLATEVLNATPPAILDALVAHNDEDEVADWVLQMLVIGKAFQQALDAGELDDI